MEDKKKKRLEEAAQFRSTDTIIDPPSPIRRHVKWKMACMKKFGQMTSEAAKKIADRIVSHFHLLMVIFYNNCWMSKPNLFHLLTTRFLGGASLIGELCRPWTLGCTDFCHWVTRTPWSCLFCWSWCHDQTIIWTGSKDLPHVFVHGFRRPRVANTKNQGPPGGLDHRKSGSTTNVLL